MPVDEAAAEVAAFVILFHHHIRFGKRADHHCEANRFSFSTPELGPKLRVAARWCHFAAAYMSLAIELFFCCDAPPPLSPSMPSQVID
jgi:hypothetical protein